MVQTRHGGATTSAQSDPPQRQRQHRYETRSVSRAESHEEAAGDRDEEVASAAPPSSAAGPRSARGGSNKAKQQAPASASRRRKPVLLEPVAEEQEEEDVIETEEEDDDDAADAADADSADADSDDGDAGQAEDSEEEAMLLGLAASIAAAFRPAAGKQQQQSKQQQHQATKQAPIRHTADDNSSSEDDDSADADDDQDAATPAKKKKLGQWSPSTGLAPAPPAARVALQQLGRPAGVSAAAGRAAPLDPKAAAKAARAQQQQQQGNGDNHTNQKRDTAGPRWYDLPATPITDDVKRELRLLRLRGAYDPKRFYKSYDAGKFPRYFAVATVQDDPLEPSSARLSRKERRRATITEQLLADGHLSSARKRRFDRLQEQAERVASMGKSGARGLAANKKQRASSAPRLPKSHHRPKH
jgi:hypothetical protein